MDPEPGHTGRRGTGTCTCVRTHTRAVRVSGCAWGHTPQTHGDAHTGSLPGLVTQSPRSPAMPKRGAQLCAPQNHKGPGAESSPGAADVPWSAGDTRLVISPAGRLTPAARHSPAAGQACTEQLLFPAHSPTHLPQLGKTNPNFLPVSKQTPSVHTSTVLPHPLLLGPRAGGMATIRGPSPGHCPWPATVPLPKWEGPCCAHPPQCPWPLPPWPGEVSGAGVMLGNPGDPD